LVDAELVYQRGLPPRHRYVFKHALIQEAAYQSLLKSTRQQYHQRIAQVLAEQFPEARETQPELLAHHYTEAGLNEAAVNYWQQAGQRALERSAHIEAISHLTRGLKILTTLADSDERLNGELALQALLASALVATQGPASAAVERAYAHARALCRQVEGAPQLAPILLGLFRFYSTRAAHQTDGEVAAQLFHLTQHMSDGPQHALAHYALGCNALHRGELAMARKYLETCQAFYDAQPFQAPDMQAGHDPNVACRIWGTWSLWALGYAEQARQRGQEGVTLASNLSHPYSLAYALLITTILHQFLCESPARIQVRAEAAMALCTAQGFETYLAGSAILRG
jgi:predicted ATPase